MRGNLRCSPWDVKEGKKCVLEEKKTSKNTPRKGSDLPF